MNTTHNTAALARIGLLGLAGAMAAVLVTASTLPIDMGLSEEIVVVARHVPTINFRQPGGVGMHVPLVATPLAADSRGQMDIDTKQGYVQVQATIHGLPSAATFGDEYMTYVLWAITPEGRATNLGEFLVESAADSKAHLEVTSELQAFGLVVTAEPHFSVTIPSNLVVMENGIPKSGDARVETVDAEYRLLERGTYAFHGESRTGLEVPSVPFYVVQARNARRIAVDSGAKTLADDAFITGERQLQEAEAQAGSDDERMTSARRAAQTFEDARLIAVEATRSAREARALLDKEAAERSARDARAATAVAQDATIKAQVLLGDARQDQAASEAEKLALRAQLRKQLQLTFDTQDTSRGLIVNMSNVLFALNQDSLQPEAREKLAKLAGVVLSTPGLHLAVEGHADSTGSDEHNLDLSQRRASSVRDYLVDQKVVGTGITAQGFGEANPIATNDTLAGRRLNRRVEIVVSGDAIGGARFGG